MAGNVRFYAHMRGAIMPDMLTNLIWIIALPLLVLPMLAVFGFVRWLAMPKCGKWYCPLPRVEGVRLCAWHGERGRVG